MQPSDKPEDFRGTVGRNARWSLVQTIVSAATVFVLYRYLYNHLGPDQLGLWAVVLASVSLGRLAELGFSTTVLRYVSQHLSKGDRSRAAQILETGLISVSLPFAVLLLICYPLLEQLVGLVVPAEIVSTAFNILPYAIGTLWLGVVSLIAQSGLDGCGRMDVKSKILIVGNFIYVPTGIMLSELWGIKGLAAGQLLQSFLVTGLIWKAARHELPMLKLIPIQWSRSCFLEIIRYAAGLQLGNLLIMLFEPATKMLLSRYCGLTEVAHFEMANQVVSRVRSLITSALQAYLPLLSSSSDDQNQIRHIVGEAFIFSAGLGLPLMAMVIVSFPVISVIWIGVVAPGFVTYGWILGIGWLVATLAMPTYYYCLGAGRIRTILAAQTLRLFLNVALGYAAALHGLANLVAIAMVFSLIAENTVTARRALSDLGIDAIKALRHKTSSKVLATVLATLSILTLNIVIPLFDFIHINVYLNFICQAFIFALIAYLSPARPLLQMRYGRRQ